MFTTCVLLTRDIPRGELFQMAIWWLKLHKANENTFCVLNAMFGIEMCASRQMSYSDWLLQATLYGLEL